MKSIKKPYMVSIYARKDYLDSVNNKSNNNNQNTSWFVSYSYFFIIYSLIIYSKALLFIIKYFFYRVNLLMIDIEDVLFNNFINI